MNEILLDNVHAANYEMLCEIDRICKKHKIHYFLHGGSLLGAIRHQNFIPWDDDVDISFLRRDYEKFIRVFSMEADPRFEFLDFRKYPQFFDFISKVVDHSITFPTNFGDEEFYEYRYAHPTVDLFVLDYECSWHRLQLFVLKVLYSLALGHRPRVDMDKYQGIEKLAASVLPRIGKKIPFPTIAKWYVAVQRWGRKGDTLFVSNEQPNPRYWGIQYQKRMYKSGKTGMIRGRKFPVPSDPDSWLRRSYGNYMELPPDKEKKPQHVSVDGKEYDE